MAKEAKEAKEVENVKSKKSRNVLSKNMLYSRCALKTRIGSVIEKHPRLALLNLMVNMEL